MHYIEFSILRSSAVDGCVDVAQMAFEGGFIAERDDCQGTRAVFADKDSREFHGFFVARSVAGKLINLHPVDGDFVRIVANFRVLHQWNEIVGDSFHHGRRKIALKAHDHQRDTFFVDRLGRLAFFDFPTFAVGQIDQHSGFIISDGLGMHRKDEDD